MRKRIEKVIRWQSKRYKQMMVRVVKKCCLFSMALRKWQLHLVVMMTSTAAREEKNEWSMLVHFDTQSYLLIHTIYDCIELYELCRWRGCSNASKIAWWNKRLLPFQMTNVSNWELWFCAFSYHFACFRWWRVASFHTSFCCLCSISLHNIWIQQLKWKKRDVNARTKISEIVQRMRLSWCRQFLI